MFGARRAWCWPVCLAGLVACSSSVGGTAVKAPQPVGSADAVLILMNTGPYATAAGRPLGTATPRRGCWKRTASPNMSLRHGKSIRRLHAFGGLIDTALSGPMATAQMIADNGVLKPLVVEVAGAHGFISGFSTARVTTQTGPESGGLIDAVLRFPDPGAGRRGGQRDGGEEQPTVPGAAGCSGADPRLPRHCGTGLQRARGAAGGRWSQ
jgi:hypothetical protein